MYQINEARTEALAQYRLSHPNSEIKKVFKPPTYPLVDEALIIWFNQARARHITLTNDLVAAQAAIFYSKLYSSENNFKASINYAQAFCKRNNFKLKGQFGEQFSADSSSIPAFLIEVAELCFNL